MNLVSGTSVSGGICLELYPSPDFELPIGPIIITAEELFPTILTTENNLFSADNVTVIDRSAEGDYLGGEHLLVLVTLNRDKGSKGDIKMLALELVKGLVDMLGSDIEIGLRLYFVNGKVFNQMAFASSRDSLPALEEDAELVICLDRVFKRLILEDPALDLDSNTGAITVLSTQPILVAAS